MRTQPAGIPEADWQKTAAAMRAIHLSQQLHIDQLCGQLTALAKAGSIAAWGVMVSST